MERCGESVGGGDYEPSEVGAEADDIVAFDDEDPHKKDEDAVPEGDKVPAPEPSSEDPEGLIEVEVERGESRYAKPGTLKREAKTLDHLMTHRYSNPFCDSCIRAKMRHFKTRKGAFKRKLSKFGDLITFDFVDMGKATEMGWRDHKEFTSHQREIFWNGSRIPGSRQIHRNGSVGDQEIYR